MKCEWDEYGYVCIYATVNIYMAVTGVSTLSSSMCLGVNFWVEVDSNNTMLILKRKKNIFPTVFVKGCP